MARLKTSSYLNFPFRIGPQLDGPLVSGAITCTRSKHIRDLIEQVLFTAPTERVYRPDWGGGAKNLVFEPMSSAFAAITQKRIQNSLSTVLSGEVSPNSLQISVTPGDDGTLVVLVSYMLATLSLQETQQFTLGVAGVAGG